MSRGYVHFMFFANASKTFILQAPNNQIVLSNVSQLNAVCSNYPKHTISCTDNCIIHQSCDCQYSANGIVIPPRILQCHNTNSCMDFPTNLAILQELIEDKEHQAIKGDSLFQEQLDVTIPTIHIFNQSFHSQLTADRQHCHKL